MRIGIAADHGGFELKEFLAKALRDLGYAVMDFGASGLNPEDDYADFVVPLARAVSDGKVDRAVAICGSGVGACVVANKVAGVRASLIHETFSAHLRSRGRRHEHDLPWRPRGRPCIGMGIGTNISSG